MQVAKLLFGISIVSTLFIGIYLPGIVCLPFIPQKVFPGITIRGIDLGGIERNEVINRLQKLEDELQKINIKLIYNSKIYQLPVSDVGVRVNNQAILQQAFAAGRQGSLWQRWRAQHCIKKEGLDIPLKVQVNRTVFERLIEDITSNISVQPRDAIITIDNDNKIEIIPSVAGLRVDSVHACMNIINVLEKGEPKPINLSLVNIAPQCTTEDVREMGINQLLGAYRTIFNPGNSSRSYNISVAASALDGLLIPPNKTVSFNEIVGPRSSEAGYKDAGIIVNNELIQGPGGGVCQVSTTLYNSVLLAGLEVVERSNHSLPVNYVPIGRDATVVYGTIDFKFRNNTGKYIYIKTIIDEGTLTIKIFGNKEYSRDVVVQTWVTEALEPKVIYENNPKLCNGQEVVKQEGTKGYCVEGIIFIYNNGVVETKKPLLKSKYNPVNRIISIGEANLE